MNLDLRGNIKSIGSVYVTVSATKHRALLQRSIVVEDSTPWRRGHGGGVHLFPGRLLSIGTWHPDYVGVDPLELEELGDVQEDIADTIEIRKWPDDGYDLHAEGRLASR